ncbi:MAG: transcriptional regulator [Candidatus Fluviicola riflensis]|nr:MAG: transcriptional regulator [Candidatus Fluviicola riflensis]OGS77855.1 MAG: transcriptional regulator [Candidatus Fluviicola riflensis]OGS84920.1 MAG: transcriptional regulator [Fluviicola sp. RIFCSPHIGHO2_01_FULL_43_53]OGS89192.1 MAG: transcriptional regulator [Fluviicola sp. RIFCSPHIGHO2_12_FULL_43_24]
MKKILLIEDNDDVRENTAEILEMAQYEVLTATNGKEGFELAVTSQPDLIICDIMMPVLDGDGVLHLLSKNPETAGIPFIFLTAKAERSDIRRGMEMGADDYLTKPFDDVDLLNAIETRFKKSEILKREYSRDLKGLNTFREEVREANSLKDLSIDRDVRTYSKKTEIFREGMYPRGIYFVNSGKVKTYQTNEHGKELITSLHSEGDFFGFLSLLKDEPYTHSAAALEDAEVCMIPKDEFFSLLFRNKEVARKFIGILAGNLYENEQHLVQLAYNSVRKRVAESLVRLSDKYHTGEGYFSMNLAREDLAQLVGTATESVIRILSDFRSDGYVEISGSTITILNYKKLTEMKN